MRALQPQLENTPNVSEEELQGAANKAATAAGKDVAQKTEDAIKRGAFGANLAYGFVDDALQLVRVGISVLLLDVLDGAMEYAPAYGFLNEFREVALFCALGT